jgi:hypothetical protein
MKKTNKKTIFNAILLFYLQNMMNKNNEILWNIIDLVIYTATDDTVLVFFHNTGNNKGAQ